jgi:hypothetical protein
VDRLLDGAPLSRLAADDCDAAGVEFIKWCRQAMFFGFTALRTMASAIDSCAAIYEGNWW